MRGVPELEERFKRQARNEALFREVNERIAQLGESAQAWSPDGGVEFMCECGVEGGCGERVRVPLDVYEQVRAQDDRFVVRPQRPRSIGVRQSRIGIQPRPCRIRLTTGLELTGPIDHEGIVARLSL